MGEETAQITVAETTEGPGGSRPAGEEVSLPVVELLTGRGFVTGKSGSGKSNSASVIAERLLDSEFGLLIVDIDGEYYGLKEEYEILHVGADEECDIQVTTEHAEKLAALALEQNVPIILDVSSYLDESEAEALLTEVARSLFAKAKKQKQPFLLLVEEIHEYIPEQGSVGECGQMLIKIGKRGRKHGLGLCGISQRPADVKKDFITQCDWLLWHRLTWQNDTRVVRRILDGEYADAVENLNDGEGFLVTDWTDDVRRVQFHRKETFDAGATPGLEDVERPDLKSVSADLVSELEEISDEASAREDRIAELEARLDQRDARIEELEQELRDARDLQDLAEQFVAALTSHPTATEGTPTAADVVTDTRPDPLREEWSDTDNWPGGWRDSVDADETEPDSPAGGVADGDGSTRGTTDEGRAAGAAATDEMDAVDGGATDEDDAESFSADRVLSKLDSVPGPSEDRPGRTAREEVELELYSDAELLESTDGDTTREASAVDGVSGPTDGGQAADGVAGPTDGGQAADGVAGPTDGGQATDGVTGPADGGQAADGVTGPTDGGQATPDEVGPDETVERLDDPSDGHDVVDDEDGDTAEGGEHASDGEGDTAAIDREDVRARMPDEEPLAVRELKAEIGGLETKTRRMLAFYREEGPASAQNAHFAAGGDGDRTQAYARNRTLRTRGLVGHVGRGGYDYRLREYLAEELGEHVDEAVVEIYASEIEETALDVEAQ